MQGPYSYSKLCEGCGMGVLHAALLSAEDSGEGEEEEEEDEDEGEDVLEQDGEDEDYEGAPESQSMQPAKAERAAARGIPSKQVRHRVTLKALWGFCYASNMSVHIRVISLQRRLTC